MISRKSESEKQINTQALKESQSTGKLNSRNFKKKQSQPKLANLNHEKENTQKTTEQIANDYKESFEAIRAVDDFLSNRAITKENFEVLQKRRLEEIKLLDKHHLVFFAKDKNALEKASRFINALVAIPYQYRYDKYGKYKNYGFAGIFCNSEPLDSSQRIKKINDLLTKIETKDPDNIKNKATDFATKNDNLSVFKEYLNDYKEFLVKWGTEKNNIASTITKVKSIEKEKLADLLILEKVKINKDKENLLSTIFTIIKNYCTKPDSYKYEQYSKDLENLLPNITFPSARKAILDNMFTNREYQLSDAEKSQWEIENISKNNLWVQLYTGIYNKIQETQGTENLVFTQQKQDKDGNVIEAKYPRCETAILLDGKIFKATIRERTESGSGTPEYDIKLRGYVDPNNSIKLEPFKSSYVNVKSISDEEGKPLLMATVIRKHAKVAPIYADQKVARTVQGEALLDTFAKQKTDGTIGKLIAMGMGTGKTYLEGLTNVIGAQSESPIGFSIFVAPDTLLKQTMSGLQDVRDNEGKKFDIKVLDSKEGNPGKQLDDYFKKDTSGKKKCLLMTPEQLLKCKDVINTINNKDKLGVFLDEVHKYIYDDKTRDDFKEICKNNETIAYTATINKTLVDNFTTVYEQYIYASIQKGELHRLAGIDQDCIECSNEDNIAQTTVINSLTGMDNLQSNEQGYNEQYIQRYSAQYQGMFFTDDPECANNINTALTKLTEDKEIDEKLREKFIEKSRKYAGEFPQQLIKQNNSKISSILTSLKDSKLNETEKKSVLNFLKSIRFSENELSDNLKDEASLDEFIATIDSRKQEKISIYETTKLSQYELIKYTIQTQIINLAIGTNIEDLREMVCNHKYNDIKNLFSEAIGKIRSYSTTNESDTQIFKPLKKLQEEHEKKGCANAKEYYDTIGSYIKKILDIKKAPTESEELAIFGDLYQKHAVMSTLLNKKSPEDISEEELKRLEENAMFDLSTGLTMNIVSTGSLSTGLNNHFLRHVSYTQTKETESIDEVASAIQSLRNLRDKYGSGWVNNYVSSSIDERWRYPLYSEIIGPQCKDKCLEKMENVINKQKILEQDKLARQEELKAKQEQYEQNKSKREQEQGAIDAIKADIAKSKQDIDALNQEIKNLQDQLPPGQINKLKKQLEELKSIKDDIQKEKRFTELSANIEKLKEANIKVNEVAKTLQEQLQSQLDAKTKEVEDLNQKVSDNDTNIVNLNEQLAKTRQQLEEAGKQKDVDTEKTKQVKADLETKIEKITQEKEEVTKERDEQIKKLNEEKQKADEVAKTLQEQLQSQLDAKTKELGELSTTNQKLTTDLNKAKAALVAASGRLETLQARVNTLSDKEKQELDKLKNEVIKLEQLVDTLQKEKQETVENLNQAKSEAKKLAEQQKQVFEELPKLLEEQQKIIDDQQAQILKQQKEGVLKKDVGVQTEKSALKNRRRLATRFKSLSAYNKLMKEIKEIKKKITKLKNITKDITINKQKGIETTDSSKEEFSKTMFDLLDLLNKSNNYSKTKIDDIAAEISGNNIIENGPAIESKLEEISLHLDDFFKENSEPQNTKDAFMKIIDDYAKILENELNDNIDHSESDKKNKINEFKNRANEITRDVNDPTKFDEYNSKIGKLFNEYKDGFIKNTKKHVVDLTFNTDNKPNISYDKLNTQGEGVAVGVNTKQLTPINVNISSIDNDPLKYNVTVTKKDGRLLEEAQRNEVEKALFEDTTEELNERKAQLNIIKAEEVLKDGKKVLRVTYDSKYNPQDIIKKVGEIYASCLGMEKYNFDPTMNITLPKEIKQAKEKKQLTRRFPPVSEPINSNKDNRPSAKP